MASIPMVLQQIRRTRREQSESKSEDRFTQYEPAYREILEAVEQAGGESIQTEVSEWILEQTEEQQQLPSPMAFEEQARAILIDHDIPLPDRLKE